MFSLRPRAPDADSCRDAVMRIARARHADCENGRPSAVKEGAQMREPSLQLRVELMDDPCRWRWEIRDGARDEVVADSWTRDWAAYGSREEASRAGRAR